MSWEEYFVDLYKRMKALTGNAKIYPLVSPYTRGAYYRNFERIVKSGCLEEAEQYIEKYYSHYEVIAEAMRAGRKYHRETQYPVVFTSGYLNGQESPFDTHGQLVIPAPSYCFFPKGEKRLPNKQWEAEILEFHRLFSQWQQKCLKHARHKKTN